jgi:signal transduction histidine kinase
MKFLNKINRNFIILFSLILAIVSIGGYFILHAILLENTKENLLEKEGLIKNQLIETGIAPNLYPIIEVTKTSPNPTAKASFKEIFLQEEMEDELEPFLEYSNQIKIKDSCYLLKLRQSSFENEDLVAILSLTLSILLLSMLGISFFITKKMNGTVWKDFENNLRKIENFSFGENRGLSLKKSDIEEFDRLNRVINSLTEKLKSDYFTLKDFTENASHEIQTPLSIVLLNLEEILQQKVDEGIFKKVVISIHALKRLSTLNQSLILLTKIENRQFKADKILIINNIVKHKLDEFDPLFESKKIKIVLQVEHEFKIRMNDHLAEILINNLLSNAVNHNTSGGCIYIAIREKELTISNTGESNDFDNETIFKKFSKGKSKSFGLGLAIVKRICETHHLEIQYLKNGMHCFVLSEKIGESTSET